MMMYYYKLMNKLFGYRYATFEWAFGFEVGRVHYDDDGKPFCYKLGTAKDPIRFIV